MVFFSISKKLAYHPDFNYSELPSDVVKVSNEKHQELIIAINSGCIIFPDLTFSAPQPSQFHTWNGTAWVDNRSEEEKQVYKRSLYPSLTRYQFKRCLLENGYKPELIEAQILTIKDEKTRALTLLGFKEATNFVRTDQSILAMQSILNLTSEKIDELWEYAMKL